MAWRLLSFIQRSNTHQWMIFGSVCPKLGTFDCGNMLTDFIEILETNEYIKKKKNSKVKEDYSKKVLQLAPPNQYD